MTDKIINKTTKLINESNLSKEKITADLFKETPLNELVNKYNIKKAEILEVLITSCTDCSLFIDTYYKIHFLAINHLEEDVSLNTNLRIDLELDSIEVVEFQMEIEKEYDLVFKDEDVFKLQSFQDVVFLVINTLESK